MLGTIPVKMFLNGALLEVNANCRCFFYRYPGSVDDNWKRFHEMTHWAIIKGKKN